MTSIILKTNPAKELQAFLSFITEQEDAVPSKERETSFQYISQVCANIQSEKRDQIENFNFPLSFSVFLIADILQQRVGSIITAMSDIQDDHVDYEAKNEAISFLKDVKVKLTSNSHTWNELKYTLEQEKSKLSYASLFMSKHMEYSDMTAERQEEALLNLTNIYLELKSKDLPDWYDPVLKAGLRQVAISLVFLPFFGVGGVIKEFSRLEADMVFIAHANESSADIPERSRISFAKVASALFVAYGLLSVAPSLGPNTTYYGNGINWLLEKSASYTSVLKSVSVIELDGAPLSLPDYSPKSIKEEKEEEEDKPH